MRELPWRPAQLLLEFPASRLRESSGIVTVCRWCVKLHRSSSAGLWWSVNGGFELTVVQKVEDGG